jgi:hypothetical protein
MGPEPPFLVIRHGKSFWVERNEPGSCAATLQAFREGCFSEASCYDETGGLWPIVAANLRQRPSIIHRVLPWLRIPVELRLGSRKQVELREVIAQLVVVLKRDSGFSDYLKDSPAEVLQRFETARTPGDVIRIAGEHAA